jgi:exonuclease VII small subunit
MTEVGEELEELLAEAEEAGVTLPEAVVAQINDLLDQAQAAFDAENFEEAEDMAEQADDLLDDLEDQVEDLIEESEEEADDDDDEDFELEGLVQSYTPGASITIDGQTFLINGDTEIEGTPAVGAIVEVEYEYVEIDGSPVAVALEIEVEDDEDTEGDDDDDDDDDD